MDPALNILIYDKPSSQLFANILPALRTILQSLVPDTGPHRTGLINQPGIFRHASIAEDLIGRYSKTEVLVPSITQFLLI